MHRFGTYFWIFYKFNGNILPVVLEYWGRHCQSLSASNTGNSNNQCHWWQEAAHEAASAHQTVQWSMREPLQQMKGVIYFEPQSTGSGSGNGIRITLCLEVEPPVLINHDNTNDYSLLIIKMTLSFDVLQESKFITTWSIADALQLDHKVGVCTCDHVLSRWQELHENERKPCELLVLFSSCGILAAGSRTDNWPWPRQTLPEPHDFTMTSFTSTTLHSPNDGSHLQLNRATSSLKDHIIIKSSLGRRASLAG